MAKNTDHLFRCMADWTGSKRALLDLAKECMLSADYLDFEKTLERGYGKQDDARDTSDAVVAYGRWCHFLGLPNIVIFRDKTLHIWYGYSKTSTRGPTRDQVEALKHLGWSVEIFDPVPTIRLVHTRSGLIEEVAQEALDILGLPFHRGLPPPLTPVKSRYERLTNPSCWLTDQ